MQTTGNGISFSLVKKPAEEENKPEKQEIREGKKPINAQLDGPSSSTDKSRKNHSDKKKGKNKKSEDDLSTPKLGSSKAARKGKGKEKEESSSSKAVAKGKNKDGQENLSTPKLDSSKAASRKGKGTSSGELYTPKLSKSRKGKSSDDAQREDEVGESSSAETPKIRSVPRGDKRGVGRRDRQIRASRADGETAKEGVRALYKHHYSLQKVEEGLESKTLFQGTLRINKRNRSESYVTVLGRDEDIFIQGVVARNRALNGDIVVLELLVGAEHDKEIEKLKQNRREKSDKEQERLKKVSIVEEQEDILIEDIMENEVDEELEDSGITNIAGTVYISV